MLYLYLGEWNPRAWDMSEVYNPMYPNSSHLKWKGALILRSMFTVSRYGRWWTEEIDGGEYLPSDASPASTA
eukprot:5302964-Pyramimonas_sp.AAC.1